MRTLIPRITWAAPILFAGLLIENAQAVTPTGALAGDPNISLIETIALSCDADKGFCLVKDAMGRWICRKFPNVPPKSNCPRM